MTSLKDKFTITSTKNYKSSDYTLVAIQFNSTNGICYDSTKTNGFTSGKITVTFDVSVPNESNTFKVISGFIFDDEHHETMLISKDNGNNSLVRQLYKENELVVAESR